LCMGLRWYSRVRGRMCTDTSMSGRWSRRGGGWCVGTHMVRYRCMCMCRGLVPKALDVSRTVAPAAWAMPKRVEMAGKRYWL